MWIRKTIEKNYYEGISSEDVYTVIGKELLDPYSDYYDPNAYAELTAVREGNRSGFGISYYANNIVANVLYNSPAYKAGLRQGMKIVGLKNGDKEIKVGETSLEFAFEFIDYQEGDEVTFYTEEGTFLVKCETYLQSYTKYITSKHCLMFQGTDSLKLVETDETLDLPDDTAYLRVTGFYGSVGQEFSILMEYFKSEGMKHLVLDLRGNGGGYLSAMQRLSSYLVKDAKGNDPIVVKEKYKNGKVDVARADGNFYHSYFSDSSEIFVLADENSASASECLIGAMVDYHTVDYSHILLSSFTKEGKTYGKGIMQNTFRYTDGSALKLTTATVHWPVSEICIHGVGVTTKDGCPTFQKSMNDRSDTTLHEMLSYIKDKLS